MSHTLRRGAISDFINTEYKTKTVLYVQSYVQRRKLNKIMNQYSIMNILIGNSPSYGVLSAQGLVTIISGLLVPLSKL